MKQFLLIFGLAFMLFSTGCAQPSPILENVCFIDILSCGTGNNIVTLQSESDYKLECMSVKKFRKETKKASFSAPFWGYVNPLQHLLVDNSPSPALIEYLKSDNILCTWWVAEEPGVPDDPLNGTET